MEVIAESKNVRVSPRKLRLIADAVKAMSPVVAVEKLKFLSKSGSLPVLKTLQSAMANALNNHKLAAGGLKIKNILIDEGFKMKRQDKSHSARYNSGLIQKRAAHVKVILEG